MIGPLYFVTDAGAPAPVAEQALAVARAGVRIVQLRDKTASDAEMIETARALRGALAPLGTRLIVNDRVEVAIKAEADGLHIGQGDGDPRAIRDRIGHDMLLGLSIDALAQLDAVPPDCVDYLGVGPLRATASKPDHAAPIGLDGVARAVAQSDLPVFAIGGVTARDAPALKATGAVGMAVVSAISRAQDMEAAARALIDAWRDP
ncbi:thiamine phosphate synthase [Roseovarius spongiae]|uniref:Thiamine-phosphate synthase n=1 Tax=Roseovarius spongiae TaxID=2320272 RepID=A0A3A8AVB8_9RHOB|nr:thiamine phosphate synthase [Roseovarius spongiae]RKF16193.1 thiamine phosphate synthase [Roseovarius spongiae]